MALEKHTGESPETCQSSLCWRLQWLLLSFLPKSINTLQTSDGKGVDSNEHSVNPTNDARHASNVSTPLTQSQAEFWYLVECQGCKELAHSLKMVHDLALYHSDIPFDTVEKSALFDVKALSEGFKKMSKKA